MKSQKQLKSLNNRLSKVESSISSLEKEIKAIDLELEINYDKTVADPNFFDAYQAKKTKLEELMSTMGDAYWNRMKNNSN